MVAATYLTIWAALTLFVLAEAGRGRGVSPFLRRRARTLSAAGFALAITHTLLAFDVFHRWSHADAVQQTAQQTADVFGIRFGAGVYVNYVFFLVWLADVILWTPARPATYNTWLIRAFYLLIIFNGAIVFASGWRRIAGAILVAALCLAWKPMPRSAPAA